VDETPRPTVTPKPTRTEDNAVAANAPSMIGDTPRCATDYRFATGGMLSIVISIASAKAEEGQDRQNYDDETGEDQSAPFTQVSIHRHSSPVSGKDICSV
jgi:hypothetical protein